MADVVQGQASFFLKVIETIRREIVSHGMGVSNLAEKTRVKRVEVGLVAGYPEIY